MKQVNDGENFCSFSSPSSRCNTQVLEARHSGRDCRNPEAMDGNLSLGQVFDSNYFWPTVSHPCGLDSGNPCRNDGTFGNQCNSTALPGGLGFGQRWFYCLFLLLAFLLVAGCASKPKIASPTPVPKATDGLLSYALSLQGIPYRWGKSSPEDGFDCSGFVWHVYRQYGYTIPRTAAQIAYNLPEVATEDRRPGDILVFNYQDQAFAHVGLYLGNDSFIHASSGKASVTVSNLDTPYWWGRFAGVRRPVR